MLTFNFSPFPVIETKRLLLREPDMEDTIAFYFLRSDERMMQYLDKAADRNLAETAEKLKSIRQAQQNNEAVMWAVALKDNPAEMIGTIGYWSIQPEHHRAEIGYLLHPLHWKKHFMKEALVAVIEYGFRTMNLHSIEANINPGNVPSAALLESCGFIQEAYHRENYYYNGVFYDSIIYSRINN